MTETIEIYCDGSCKDNGSSEAIGGIGVVMLHVKDNIIVKEKVFFEMIPEKGITNNYAEVYSAIRSLHHMKLRNIPIVFYSDSQYLVNTINLGWAKRYNIELWEELTSLLLQFRSVEFRKVKGHSGNKYNELADRLAGESY